MSNGPTQRPFLAKNAVLATSAALLANVCMVLIDLALVRGYGKTRHGDVVWVMSVGWLAMLFGDLGLLSAALVRRIAQLRARDPDQLGRAISNSTTLAMCLLVVPAGILIVLADSFAAGRGGVETLWVRLAGIWVLLLGGIKACKSIVAGFERLADVLFMTPVDEAGKLLWLGACLLEGWGLTALLAGWTVVHAAALACSMLRVRRLGSQWGFRIRPSLPSVGRAVPLVANGLMFFLPSLWHVGMAAALILLLGFWHEGGQVSVLKVCLSWAAISKLLVAPMGTALMPRVAWADATSAGQLARLRPVFGQIARVQGLIGSLAFLACWVFGSQLLTALYGQEYSSGWSTLVVLAFTGAMINADRLLGDILLARGRPRVVAVLEGLRYAVLAGLAAWLVPGLGAEGIGWAVCGAVAVNLSCKLLASWDLIGWRAACSFLMNLAVLGVVAASGTVTDAPAVPVLAWAAAVLGLRVLRPAEIWDWTKTVLRILKALPDSGAASDTEDASTRGD